MKFNKKYADKRKWELIMKIAFFVILNYISAILFSLSSKWPFLFADCLQNQKETWDNDYKKTE